MQSTEKRAPLSMTLKLKRRLIYFKHRKSAIAISLYGKYSLGCAYG